jgi:hypothetical protein
MGREVMNRPAVIAFLLVGGPTGYLQGVFYALT